MATVEYCELTTLSKTKNSIRLRYKLLEPGFHKLMLHLQLMTKGSESVDGAPNWQPFLYEINLDFCRFWKKNRSNHLAKMIFNFIEGHSNLNHSCPFLTEDYFAIEGITNTEISSKIHGLPMAKGFYALYTKWLTENITRIQTNYYFEVLSV
ncbi:uncharacterized protein LOC108094232 [Drosophila ficusphila]|uniref:uncharacterized protein LOC108094232 n=1 Tax=Drosophila ficusphila TaxID=30025 RepID=UPI0007E8B548|nr:uncharacterized protein LOC108094232 [Drosophila ficusphila]